MFPALVYLHFTVLPEMCWEDHADMTLIGGGHGVTLHLSFVEMNATLFNFIAIDDFTIFKCEGAF